MIRVKLTSIIVNDQDRARRFYTEILGFVIKHDIPMGAASWLTVTPPDAPDGVELLLEPAGHPASAAFQQALYRDGVPLTQLYTDDLRQEHRRLKALGVAFRGEPKQMGPTLLVDFDDTCGNLIRLVEG
ncbi:MAG TPA: VOC family protein [Caulobacteraceae bacterium]|nr:VOC family protein [Caulobacteraceae bacterium]